MTGAPGTPTLEQLRTLVEVAETGSFTAAAARMNRANSVVSYTIANLEAQLGLMLFDRATSRRPQLTEAGRIVLAEAQIVVGTVGTLRSKVHGMLEGLEGELSVVLDSLLPSGRVTDALKAFGAEFPGVTLHLHVETLGAVAKLVLDATATVGVSGPFVTRSEALRRISVGHLRMVPVAAPGHPLAHPPAEGHAAGVARHHVQLVVYDRSDLTRGQDFSVSGSRTWRLADLSAKHMLLREGIGWGMMPLAMVADDLAAGRLVQLELPDRIPFDYPVDAIHRSDTAPGPAATWLIHRFRSQGAA